MQSKVGRSFWQRLKSLRTVTSKTSCYALNCLRSNFLLAESLMRSQRPSIRPHTQSKSTSTRSIQLSTLLQQPDQRQIDHEVSAHRQAIDRLRKDVLKLRQKNYYSATLPAVTKIAQLVLPFSAELVGRVSKYTGRSTGPAPFINYQKEIVALLDIVEPEVVSLIFLKSLFDAAGAYDRMTIQKVSGFVGSRLEDEVRFRYYEGLGCERLTTAATRRVSCSGSTPHYRRKATRIISEKIATEEQLPLWEEWSTPKKCGISFYLIEIAQQAGLVLAEKAYVSVNRQQTFLRFTPQLLEQQQLLMADVESMSFHQWPLIVPPLPWITSPEESRHNFSGGYHSDLCRNQLPMCRGRHYRTVFGSATTDFLNVLGRTAWSVDRDVFSVASQCFSDGVTVGSLKAVFDRSVVDQPMPEHIKCLPTDHEQRREWRKTAAALHEQHHKAQKRSIRSREALSLARQYLDYPRFYLSWSADYRGRAYAQQPFLQPQSTEFEKSLIRFADGCRLDENDQRWVEIGIGASFLGTKGSFIQRQSWCRQNLDLIKAVASDPIGTISHWEAADEPWHFLQLCLEYQRVVVEGTQALWGVPLQVDATSSGLQLLSGALLDPVGCLYSNVTSSGSEQPQDAYMEVVGRARELAAANPEWHQYVPYLIDRSLGKASLLVAIYGGSHGTRTKRVIQSLMSSGCYPDPLGWKDANAIAAIVQQASIQIFPLAFKALEWIKKLGKIALANGSQEFVWSTPTGDRIALRELERESKEIRTKHLGRLTVATGYSGRLDSKAMINALAPSFVHSLDACVLKAALADWRHPVASIHDCVAVLPSDMDRMLDRLRKAFVFTVSGNPLARLADDLGVTPHQLPRLDQGQADLSSISQYLFN
jgi:DNA-directed RNA polymerase